VWNFGRFLLSNPIPGIGLVLGPLISIGALVIDAQHLIDLKLPIGEWEAIGGTVFFLSVIGILYRWWHQDIVEPTTSSGRRKDYQIWPVDYSPQVVSNRRFANTVVALDNISCSDCVFENVTFKYNGDTPLRFAHNTVSGTMVFASDNPAVLGTLFLVQGFGISRSPFTIVTQGANQNVVDHPQWTAGPTGNPTHPH
jgi:hypothetical protein